MVSNLDTSKHFSRKATVVRGNDILDPEEMRGFKRLPYDTQKMIKSICKPKKSRE